jgi:hypothetical protein
MVIQDHKFFGDLTVLLSNGIDVILGMDWITAHKGVISTSSRLVTLVHPDGTRVTFEPMKSRDIPVVYSFTQKPSQMYQWFVSLRMFFQKSCPVYHLTVMWSLRSTWWQGLHR